MPIDQEITLRGKLEFSIGELPKEKWDLEFDGGRLSILMNKDQFNSFLSVIREFTRGKEVDEEAKTRTERGEEL